MTLELTTGELVSLEIAIAGEMRKAWQYSMQLGEPEIFATEMDELADIRIKTENYWSQL